MSEYVDYCAEEKDLDTNKLTEMSKNFADFQKWAYTEKSIILGD